MIIVNQIRCNKCGDEPFSMTVHDYRTCKCGAVAVDGGLSYLRRVGDDWTEMSYSLPKEVVDQCIDALNWAKDFKRNELGTVIAIIRALRENGRLIANEDINSPSSDGSEPTS
jgi:hypothetical protein